MSYRHCGLINYPGNCIAWLANNTDMELDILWHHARKNWQYSVSHASESWATRWICDWHFLQNNKKQWKHPPTAEILRILHTADRPVIRRDSTRTFTLLITPRSLIATGPFTSETLSGLHCSDMLIKPGVISSRTISSNGLTIPRSRYDLKLRAFGRVAVPIEPHRPAHRTMKPHLGRLNLGLGSFSH